MQERRRDNAASLLTDEAEQQARPERQEYLNAWKTFGSLLVTSAPFRRYLRELWPPRSALRLFGYFGYGIFASTKSAIGMHK